MGILSKIFDRLRHHGSTAPADAGAPAAGTATTTAQAPAANQPAGTQPASLSNVDMETVLESLAAKNSQKLNWRTSIVDLMKLLGMDSTLAERRELADELGYKGDKNDTAAMNMWLHEQVIQKVAANGGKVPASMMT